jgi:hypothetical protein
MRHAWQRRSIIRSVQRKSDVVQCRSLIRRAARSAQQFRVIFGVGAFGKRDASASFRVGCNVASVNDPKRRVDPVSAAYGQPSGRMWQDRQCPSAARTSPLAIDSAVKLAVFGRSMGAIAARHDNNESPSSQGRPRRPLRFAKRRIFARCQNSSLR